ncbi:MAG: cupin domain-containing protein [Cyanobacteria bacterium P01_D01_bin.156]
MKIHNPKTVASELPLLELSIATTEADAIAALRILDHFEGLMAGVTHFSGLTPWECHPQDELLYVLDGSVEVTLWHETDPETSIVSAGDMCVVPKGVWHRQISRPAARLLFITGDTEVSYDERPLQPSAAMAPD